MQRHPTLSNLVDPEITFKMPETDTTTILKEDYRLKLPTFTGDSTEGRGWLRKFDLLAKQYKWTNEMKINMISFHLADQAETWYYTLDESVTESYVNLRKAFEEKYVDNEPILVLEQKLAKLRLKPGDDIDKYTDNFCILATKLKRNKDSMATEMAMKMPTAMRDYVTSTDTHTWDNYVKRAKYYAARADSDKSVSIVTPGTSTSIVNHTETANYIENRPNQDRYNRSRSPYYRSRSPYRFSRSPHRQDRKQRSRSNTPNGRYSKSPNRSRSKSPYHCDCCKCRSKNRSRSKSADKRCWICNSSQHLQKDCNQSN